MDLPVYGSATDSPHPSWRPGCGPCSSASYDAEDQLSRRIRRITSERNHLRLRLMAMGVYSMDSHANFVYLPMARRPWSEVFTEAGLQIRCYPDGGARITIGDLPSTLAVLSAVEKSLA
jgi:histidinol-phosphate aminotransferase